MFCVFFVWNTIKFCDKQTSEPPLREPIENCQTGTILLPTKQNQRNLLSADSGLTSDGCGDNILGRK